MKYSIENKLSNLKDRSGRSEIEEYNKLFKEFHKMLADKMLRVYVNGIHPFNIGSSMRNRARKINANYTVRTKRDGKEGKPVSDLPPLKLRSSSSPPSILKHGYYGLREIPMSRSGLKAAAHRLTLRFS